MESSVQCSEVYTQRWKHYRRKPPDGSDISISVTDSGEGIPNSEIPYVFDLFLQADGSTTRRHGGLGLGLVIVRRLVLAHGGVVHQTSGGVGKGAAFVFQLPAQAAFSIARGNDENGLEDSNNFSSQMDLG